MRDVIIILDMKTIIILIEVSHRHLIIKLIKLGMNMLQYQKERLMIG
jgi:hypothetical protein